MALHTAPMKLLLTFLCFTSVWILLSICSHFPYFLPLLSPDFTVRHLPSSLLHPNHPTPPYPNNFLVLPAREYCSRPAPPDSWSFSKHHWCRAMTAFLFEPDFQSLLLLNTEGEDVLKATCKQYQSRAFPSALC